MRGMEMKMFHTTGFNWLPEVILGFEGEEDEQSSSTSDDSGDTGGDDQSREQDGKSSSNSDDASGSSDDDDDSSSKGDDYKELKEALEKERRLNKTREKELTKLKKAHDDAELAKKDESEQERTRREQAEERLTKLSSGFLKSSLNLAIKRAAEKANFIDAEDAIAGVDRSKLTYEQDEDDPSDVDIDAKSIEREVKALAARKPHFIQTGTDDGEPSGSTFGGAGRRRGKKADEEALRKKYPSLNY